MTAGNPPTVAIVGRPNVGKSTLFNRLIGRRRAITLGTPGVTRDSISAEVTWDGCCLRLLDTGGLRGDEQTDLARQVQEHAIRSLREARLAIVVFDAREGLNPLDAEIVELLDRLRLPALYTANKADGPAQEAALVDFCRLGIDAPLGVSAEHAIGIGEIRRLVVERIGREKRPDETELGPAEKGSPCRVAIVGRPNVGKSSLLNTVAGTRAALVHSAPGTTRDGVDLSVERNGRPYLLVDTAGMRRPSRITQKVEQLSVSRTLEAIRRCDVALLLIEPLEEISDQDARIARRTWEQGRGLLIMMNKMDLLPAGADEERIREKLRSRYPTLRPVPIGFMSLLRGQGIDRCFQTIDRVHAAHHTQVRTAELNRILAAAVERRQPPIIGRARLRLFYAVQTATAPPTFTFFTNRESVPTDYVRFLERCIREQLGLEGSPLRLRFSRRSSHGPTAAERR